MLGTVGQFLILTAFVSVIISGVSFLVAAKEKSDAGDWRRIARAAWGVTTVTVLGASVILLYLIATHQFQYAYVYQYTSRSLPKSFLYSAFWVGQEGSFMLWILFTSLIGIVLTRTARSFEAPVMAVVAMSQFFLLSMVVGLKIGDLTIGSSPFMTLVERFPDAPIFQQQPDFVPADGNGMNDLLQNYWNVFHPPTLFAGFATMAVPFAFAAAGLWKRRYKEWIRPALPWALFATMVLGMGIALGGYWAYVTLSFGGYWAWDPVENSSLVPWLVSVAAVHTMITQKKSSSSLKASIVFTVLAYVLVIYSTFLTRSGILGDISVHSFVDLGLHNQLLLWITSIGVVGGGLLFLRYREMPVVEREVSMMSREFLIFSGAMLVAAVAAVILLGTSAPILGRIFRDNPSAVPVAFYNKWTLPITVCFIFLVGLGQLFWWHKMSVEQLNRMLVRPIALSVASTIAVLLFTPFVAGTVGPPQSATDSLISEAGILSGIGSFWSQYGSGILILLLLFAAFFAFYSNSMVLWRIGRGNPRLAGGALAHVGLVLVIFGIITSGVFSNPLSPDADTASDNRSNFVLSKGETRTVEGYQVTYRGQEQTRENRPVYILDFVSPNGHAFTLKPVVYQSSNGQWIQHPDVKMFFEKDIYASVSPNVMFENSGSNPNELRLAVNDSTIIGENQFAVRFKGFDSVGSTDSTQISVAAVLDFTDLKTGETRTLRPVYMIMNDRSQQFVPTEAKDWGFSIAFVGMNVDSGEAHFFLNGINVMPEDWLVVQSYEKPFINLLWIGIILLTLGFLVSLLRRVQDLRLSYQRGLV
jgi:cytochrome c-type biogenesis protein CcmF